MIADVSGDDGAAVGRCCSRITAIAKEASARKIELTAEARQLLLNQQQALLKSIQADHAVTLSVGNPRDPSQTLAIRGGDIAAVEAVRRRISSISSKPVQIKAAVAARLMEQKAKDLRALEITTSTRIQLAPRPAERDAPVGATVCGEPAGITTALAALAEREAAGAANTVPVPADALGFIVGPKGATIKGLQLSHSVRIDIVRGTAPGLMMTGEPEAVAAAKVAVAELLAGRSITRVVRISVDRVAALVGRGGATIKALAAETGAKIDVDRQNHGRRGADESGEVPVRVYGREAAVELACARVAEMAAGLVRQRRPVLGTVVGPEELAAVEAELGRSGLPGTTVRLVDGGVVQEVELSGPLEGVAVGWLALFDVCRRKSPSLFADVQMPAGLLEAFDPELVRKIMQATGTHIDPAPSRQSMLVCGAEAEAVAEVLEKLEGMKIGYEKTHLELTMPESMVGTFIGKGGKGIKQFQKEHNVDVTVQKGGGNHGAAQVLLSGEDVESVAAAKAVLEAAIAAEAGRYGELTIEEQDIPRLLGKGGETIRELQKTTGTDIRIDRQAGTVKAFAADAAKVASALEAIEELLASEGGGGAGGDFISGSVQIEQHQIGLIIGKGGETVRELQQRTGVRFDIDRDEMVVRLRGKTEEAVDLAIDAIKELQEADDDDDDHDGGDGGGYGRRGGGGGGDVVSGNVPIQQHEIGLIIGAGGATIRELEASTGARIDVDRDEMVVRLQGKTEEIVDAAVAAIKELQAADAGEGQERGGGGGSGGGGGRRQGGGGQASGSIQIQQHEIGLIIGASCPRTACTASVLQEYSPSLPTRASAPADALPVVSYRLWWGDDSGAAAGHRRAD